jgi:hypothetical protein
VRNKKGTKIEQKEEWNFQLCEIYLAFPCPFDSGKIILKHGTHVHPIIF